ncbi:MAG: HAD family hydrolase, partial [Verrucomicrobiales bacterium]
MSRLTRDEAEAEELRGFLGRYQRDYELGRLSTLQFLTHARSELPFFKTDEEFTRAWQEIFTPLLPMWALVDELAAAGHRLILFSNTSSLHCRYFLKEYAVFQHFPHHHFSQRVHALKPDPAFYEAAVREFGLVPEETIYFDDMAENVASGEALGFRSFQYDYRQHGAALAWLAEELGQAA